jgi:hypothetical protein
MTKQQLREVIRHLIKKTLNEATMWEPEIEEPEIDTDTETEEEEDDDLNIGGNPNTNPKMPPQAITPKEKAVIKQIIARYMSLSNLNEKKYK